MLRISTFNVHFGKRTDQIVETIKENRNLSRADIFLLQEIEAYTKEGKERAHRIADGLEMFCKYAPARLVKDQGTHGLAILSRYPIKNHEVTQLEFYKLFRRSRTRIALNAEIDYKGRDVLISNVHLDTALNFAERSSQIYSVLKELKSSHIQKIILGGDLNTLPFRWAKNAVPYFYDNQVKKMYEFLKEHGFESAMQKLDYTLRHGPLKLSLDAIYTRGVAMSDFGVERTVRVSDHKPVWADVRFE